MSAPVRVVVADDQRVVREGLTLLLGLLADVEVVGAVADGAAAVAAAERLRPDVVLMDLHMPRCDGVEATRLLLDAAPCTRVIALTTYADERSVVAALRAGARGFLTKDTGADEIATALRAVMDGSAVLDPSVQHHVVDALGAEASATAVPDRTVFPDGLTAREAEVLTVISEGCSNTEIAARLHISETTVKSHVNRILAKIGARDRAQAVVYAYRHGLTSS
jgi:DNA-binding NarL/FixJ family response regulator